MWHGVGMEIAYGMLRLFTHSEFVDYSCQGACERIRFQSYLILTKVNPSGRNKIVGAQETNLFVARAVKFRLLLKYSYLKIQKFH